MDEAPMRHHPFARFEAHPFEGREAARACSFCGEHRAHILHHPTRIRAACLLRGIDPAPLLARQRSSAAA
jgi:hypothetical protein